MDTKRGVALGRGAMLGQGGPTIVAEPGSKLLKKAATLQAEAARFEEEAKLKGYEEKKQMEEWARTFRAMAFWAMLAASKDPSVDLTPNPDVLTAASDQFMQLSDELARRARDAQDAEVRDKLMEEAFHLNNVALLLRGATEQETPKGRGLVPMVPVNRTPVNRPHPATEHWPWGGGPAFRMIPAGTMAPVRPMDGERQSARPIQVSYAERLRVSPAVNAATGVQSHHSATDLTVPVGSVPVPMISQLACRGLRLSRGLSCGTATDGGGGGGGGGGGR